MPLSNLRSVWKAGTQGDLKMSITYPADIEASIRRMVESSRYSDPVAALREAVRLL
jgi:Arc/MetJ-type ribon-helix-helix transcriptional regulator